MTAPVLLVLSALERLGRDTLRCDDVDHSPPPAECIAIYRCQQALRHRLEQLVLILIKYMNDTNYTLSVAVRCTLCMLIGSLIVLGNNVIPNEIDSTDIGIQCTPLKQY